ncbi:hypothetical protein PT300_09860 [Enterobacteriaceae bacterium ESL0689]|nr:hypothetical protein [Enterobacteriaceae bacterium ESL0689]
MDESLVTALSVKLCSADMICGFISVSPVLDNRSELIQQRLKWYRDSFHSRFAGLQQETQIADEIFSHLLMQAVELTAADIICDAIALAPVLYDRDEKIIENVNTYFSWLQSDINCDG